MDMNLIRKEAELRAFKRLITEVTPSGIVSIVSDTFDFWNVITNISRELKDVILNRPVNALGMAKVVFRPDSGDPIDILCGTAVEVKELKHDSIGTAYGIPKEYEAVKYNGKYYQTTTETRNGRADWIEVQPTPAMKGAVECLWEIFGGTTTEKGFKQLHERVGLIYGDSITVNRANEILRRLMNKGFASGNVVFGVGSYSYQWVTRDSYGIAVKATAAIVNGEFRELFKDPVTDDGMKKSAKGLLRVERENGKYVLYDQQTWEQEAQGCLEVVFKDGKLARDQTLAEIRTRLMSEYGQLKK